MMIAVAIATTTTYAQKEVVKSITKAKTYDEALSLIKANESTMSSSEKAEAYNKLVDLSLDKYNSIGSVVTQNQLNMQMGQKDKVVAYDTAGYNKMAYLAVEAAIECNKYDNMPNEKGKVKPRFKGNAQRVWGARTQLVNAGQDAARANNDADVLKYWGFFVDTETDPLFAEMDKSSEKPYFGQVAFFAGVYAYQAKEYDRADKYADVAMKDSAQHKDALNLKLTVMGTGMKTKADSLAFEKKLEEIYEQDKSNELVFTTLGNLYTNLQDSVKLEKLIDEKLVQDPNNSMAWALKGQTAMNKQKYDDAITYFKKSIEAKEDNALVLTYLGFSINAKASMDQNKQKELCAEAASYLEKARAVDPNRQQANWSYPLYQSYYIIYGADDSRTKEVEALTK